MVFRRRTVLKYLFLIPTLWFSTVIILSLRDTASSNLESQKEILVKNNDRNMSAPSFVERLINVLPFKNLNFDLDHPIEERHKALKQAQEMKALVQVPAPGVDNNLKNGKVAGPGEMGTPVRIDKDKLSPEELAKFSRGWRDNAFNQYVSDMISLRRTLADVRDPECKKVKFLANLPDVTVIIIFHNEARSVLLRTVWSVLDRSAPHLLKEVILVDDFSDQIHLKQQLEDDIRPLSKVRLIRTSQREGLIRARLAGAYEAQGKVLVFLDSHCECAEGWLEPLLDPIARNPKVSVVPLIEIIDDSTFEFHVTAIDSIQVGGFDWNLIFNWHVPPANEMKRRKAKTDPIRSPTMAGGLFAIDRQWFEDLGMYDPGMDIWGGENLELSFKLWQCGGELLCAPCSHVGHIFRKRSPYSWPKDTNVVKKNTVRLAEVWLDEYKQYYYERINFDLGDYGDVSDRRKIRERLQCKPFKWFIDNIYPEQFIPGDSLFYGEIRSQANTQMCIDSQEIEDADKAVIAYGCHGQGGNQYFLLSKDNEIRREEKCFDYSGGQAKLNQPAKVMSMMCHGMKGNQMWFYQDNMIRHASGYCMQLSNDNERHIIMAMCDPTNSYQKWSWKARQRNSTIAIKAI